MASSCALLAGEAAAATSIVEHVQRAPSKSPESAVENAHALLTPRLTHSDYDQPEPVSRPLVGIARLPAEVLADVLADTVDGEDDWRAPLRLTHVCGLWRALAQSRSRLWRSLTLHGDDARAAATAQHWITLSRDSVQVLGVCSAGALTAYHRMLAEGFLRSVRELAFRGHLGYDVRLGPIPASIGALPTLTSLSYVTPSPVFVTADDIPSLVSVEQFSVQARLVTFAVLPPFAALRSLHLDTGIVIKGIAHANSYSALLQQCPLLEQLIVRTFASPPTSTFGQLWHPNPVPLISLPHLRSLELRGTYVVAPFVGALRDTDLRSLAIEPAGRECAAVLDRIGTADLLGLQTLSLNISSESQNLSTCNRLLHFLRAMPRLAELELRRGNGAGEYTNSLVDGLADDMPALCKLVFWQCGALAGAPLIQLVRARLSPGKTDATRLGRIVLHACPLVDMASRETLAQLVPDFLCTD
ncbi:hypothetical protein AURDEDRAFT_162627 [Auricularia subglabra TFB-10046 SS5]|nr:hypothetical protein AURDEDRAFT_162627 [Auricularia subglabra TFB-10046 SS5]